MTLLVTLLSPVLIGYLAVRALTPKLTPTWAGTLLHLFLGAGCGVGLLSLLYFAVRITIGPSVTGYWIGEAVLLAAAAGGCWLLPRGEAGMNHTARWGSWLLAALFLAIVGTHAVSFLHATEAAPQGGWDAWAIWNLRAKFLAQPDATWTGAFSPFLSDLPGSFATHPDYPLLLSSYVARSWTVTSSIGDVTVPAVVCALFWSSTIAVLVTALAVLRSWTLGLLGGFILLSNATFALNAPTQYADIPIGFFILSTFVLLLMADKGRDETMTLAGFAMGCAAWTKDEGILFAAVMGAALLLCLLLSKLSTRQFLFFATGAALPVTATLYFKIFLAKGAGSWSTLTFSSALHQIADPARYSQIFWAFWGEATSMETSWIALVLLAALLGLRLRSPMLWTGLAVCSTMLVGVFGVYLVTPFDLTWHLGTSLGRVLTQLVPAVIFLVAASCRTPEETATPPAAPEPVRPKRKKR